MIIDTIKNRTLFFLIAVLCLSSAALKTAASDDAVSETWWIIADTHIGSHRTSERFALQSLNAAVADVNELAISQKAIVLGDLVHDSPEFLDSYENSMNGLNHEWADVLGNHDFDRHGTGKRVKERTFFSKQIGGIRLIALSDDGRWKDGVVEEGYQTETNLMRDQDDWFRSELDKSPDQPTILLSHQGLRRMYKNPNDDGPCFWDPERRGWLQKNWDQYNIVMWIHGHRHEWALEENYRGWGFVDVSPGALGCIASTPGGIFMTITDDGESTVVSLRFRGHLIREWIRIGGELEYVLSVSNETGKKQQIRAGILP